MEKEAEEEAKEEQDDDDYTRVEMVFNSPMTEFSENSDTNDLIERMLAHIKTQVGNSRMPEGSLDKIIHLFIKIDPCQIVSEEVKKKTEKLWKYSTDVRFKKLSNMLRLEMY